jgi:hypothetical protein
MCIHFLAPSVYCCFVVNESSGKCVVNRNKENVQSKNMECFTTCVRSVLPGTWGKDLMMMIAPRLKHVGMESHVINTSHTCICWSYCVDWIVHLRHGYGTGPPPPSRVLEFFGFSLSVPLHQCIILNIFVYHRRFLISAVNSFVN